MSIFTPVPSSGIAADTSKATRKPPTQAQRDEKNRKLRAKRAAQAQVEAGRAAHPVRAKAIEALKAPPVVSPPKLALDALPRTIVKGKAMGASGGDNRKDKGGRRAIYGEPMHTVSFKCTKEQHATFIRVGGNVYLRDRLDELTAEWKRQGCPADWKLKGGA